MWIVEKALYRRMHNPDLDDFVYPYDLGWWMNIKQVFNNDCVAKGAGIEWPVIDGCNQYTLTVSFVYWIHLFKNLHKLFNFFSFKLNFLSANKLLRNGKNVPARVLINVYAKQQVAIYHYFRKVFVYVYRHPVLMSRVYVWSPMTLLK